MQRGASSVHFSYYDESGQSRTDQRPKKSPSKLVSSGQPSKLTDTQLDKLNIVSKDRNWIQTVSKEKDIARTWQKNWTFLVGHDPEVQTKVEMEYPNKSTMFSDQIPNTTSGNYGAYLNLEPSRNIQFFEQKFNRVHRKKPMDGDLARP